MSYLKQAKAKQPQPSALRVRGGSVESLAAAVRTGDTVLNYNGRTGGHRLSSAAMTTSPGSYNTAKRVTLRPEARTYQVLPVGAPRVRHRELTAKRWGQSNTEVRTALCAGSAKFYDRVH